MIRTHKCILLVCVSTTRCTVPSQVMFGIQQICESAHNLYYIGTSYTTNIKQSAQIQIARTPSKYVHFPVQQQRFVEGSPLLVFTHLQAYLFRGRWWARSF